MSALNEREPGGIADDASVEDVRPSELDELEDSYSEESDGGTSSDEDGD